MRGDCKDLISELESILNNVNKMSSEEKHLQAKTSLNYDFHA